MKTKNKSTKYIRLFKKYTTKGYLTKKQIKKLMKIEFRLSYTIHVFNAFMNIWSTKVVSKQVVSKQVITKDTFIKLFKGPDGFFRDIQL